MQCVLELIARPWVSKRLNLAIGRTISEQTAGGISCALYSPRPQKQDLLVWLSHNCFSFPCIESCTVTMRLREYSQDEAVNCTLQMQMRREVKKLKGDVFTSASDVLSAANVMVALSSTTVMRLALILPEESNDGTLTLSFPFPLKKT